MGLKVAVGYPRVRCSWHFKSHSYKLSGHFQLITITLTFKLPKCPRQTTQGMLGRCLVSNCLRFAETIYQLQVSSKEIIPRDYTEIIGNILVTFAEQMLSSPL